MRAASETIASSAEPRGRRAASTSAAATMQGFVSIWGQRPFGDRRAARVDTADRASARRKPRIASDSSASAIPARRWYAESAAATSPATRSAREAMIGRSAGRSGGPCCSDHRRRRAARCATSCGTCEAPQSVRPWRQTPPGRGQSRCCWPRSSSPPRPAAWLRWPWPRRGHDPGWRYLPAP